MDFMSLDNIPDPNQFQNRVPSEVELVTLRNIRAQKQQVANTVASQLALAKEAYGRIQSRYRQLQHETEAIQSELNISYNFIKTLETQKTLLDAADQQIAGLLHPVRRCPQDILRIIFEYAVQGKTREYFRAATAISHVCQIWRAVALDTRILWTKVVVSIGDPPNEVKSFSERIRALVHSTPVEITIAKIGEKPIDTTAELFQCLELNEFDSIDRLHFSLASSAGAMHLIQPTFGSQSTSVQAIRVSSPSTPGGPSILSVWDFTSMLRHFSATQSLLLDGIDDLAAVVLGGNDTFSSLEELRLIDVNTPFMASQLQRLPNLKVLEMRGDFELLDVTGNIVMPNLEYLDVLVTQGFPWSDFNAPKLEEIGTDDGNPDVMDFFCRHPLIRDLMYRGVLIDQAGIERLSTHLTRLESMDVMTDTGHFTTLNQDTGLPLCPRLHTLAIGLDEEYIPSLQEVQEFVRARCQPSPASQRGDLTLISCWNINGDLNKLEDAEWRTDPVLEGCQQSLEKWEPEYGSWAILSLTWPAPSPTAAV